MEAKSVKITYYPLTSPVLYRELKINVVIMQDSQASSYFWLVPSYGIDFTHFVDRINIPATFYTPTFWQHISRCCIIINPKNARELKCISRGWGYLHNQPTSFNPPRHSVMVRTYEVHIRWKICPRTQQDGGTWPFVTVGARSWAKTTVPTWLLPPYAEKWEKKANPAPTISKALH